MHPVQFQLPNSQEWWSYFPSLCMSIIAQSSARNLCTFQIENPRATGTASAPAHLASGFSLYFWNLKVSLYFILAWVCVGFFQMFYFYPTFLIYNGEVLYLLMESASLPVIPVLLLQGLEKYNLLLITLLTQCVCVTSTGSGGIRKVY